MQAETYSPATALEDRGHIGEGVFALGVVGLNLFERSEQFAGGDAINSRIDFAKLAFFIRRVFLFDDLHKFARMVSHDASITERIFQPHRQDRADRSAGAMFLYQRSHCL